MSGPAVRSSTRRSCGRRLDERGSAAVELVLLAPVLLVLLMVAVAAGRFSLARGRVDEAARDAAREASTWRTAGEATAHGTQRGLNSLAASKMACRSPSVRLDTAGLRPGGVVTADVTCVVDLSDLLGLGIGGRRTFHARAVSVVDTFRSDP